MLHRTLIGLAAAIAIGSVPVATNALAADHPGGHAGGGHAGRWADTHGGTQWADK